MPIDSSSIYDYAFWMMYHEDNPVTMTNLKLKLTLGFGVHLLALYFYFKDLPFNKPFHFGDTTNNIVRATCVMMLHLKSFPAVKGSIRMMIYLLQNHQKFACDSLAYPAMIALFKLWITLIAEIASMLNLLYLDDEIKMIKFFALILAVATFD